MADNSVIGALRVTLGLDSAQFEDGLKRASDRLGGFGTTAKAHAHGIGAAFDEIFDRSRLKLLDTGVEKVGLFGSAFEKLGVAGIAAGVGIGAAALAFEALNKNLEMADKLGKLAQQVGVPVEELSKLKYAADLSDVSLEQLGVGLTRLAKNMAETSAKATSPAAQAFEKLGVHVTNTDGTLRSSADVLADVAGKFSGMQDGATKTALAVALFGRSGADLIPLLNQGKEGLAAMGAEAQQLGAVITEKTAAQAEDFNDTLKRLGTAFKGVGMEVTANMAPGLETLAHVLLDAAKNGSAMHEIAVALTVALKSLASVAVILGAAFAEAWELGSGVVKVAAALVRGDINGALAANKATGQGMVNVVTASAKTLGALWTGQTPAGVSPEAHNARTGAPPAFTDPEAAKKASQVREASEAAIDKATKDELAARLALTKNIEEVADLKLQQVETERRDAVTKLEEQANQGKITKAARDIAIAKTNQAAEEKRTAIQRERDFALADQALAQRQAIAGFLDRAAQIESQLATTAEQQNRIDQESLARRQQIEADMLAEKLRQQVIAHAITQAMADEQLQDLARAQAEEALAQVWQQRQRTIRETATREASALSSQIEILQSQAALSRSTYAQAVAAAKILEVQHQRELIEAQAAVDAAQVGSVERQEAEDRLKALKARHATETELAKRETTLDKALGEASNAAKDLKDAIGRHDWASVFDDFQRTIQTIQSAFANQGTAGGLMSIGSVAAQLIGGRAGNAIGGGIGIAAGAGALGTALINAGSLGALGGLSGGAMALGSVLGPIGMIAGAAYALYELLKGKPSNHSGAADLTPTSFSVVQNSKSTDETIKAVTTAAQAVLQGEALLRAAGVTLSTTVSNIDIGARDPTHITLSNGTRFDTSTVGDAADAAEKALKAVLADAHYTSEAQKHLVESMVAAGKGFDDISAALQTYAQAQQISAGLADQILQLTDAKAYDLKQVSDAIAAQRKSAQDLADQGYLTADQLASVNAQLDTLKGLQIDQVMKRYADTTNQAIDQVKAQLDAAKSAVDGAHADLQAAYDAEANAVRDNIQKYAALSSSLHGFSQTLKGEQMAMAGPRALAAARAAVSALADRLAHGDVTAAEQAQGIGQQLLDLSKSGAEDQLSAARDLASVRDIVDRAANLADNQVNIGEAQLDALNQQVAGLLQVNQSVLSVRAAIAAYFQSLTVQAAAQAANDHTGVTTMSDAALARYIADNPDLKKNWDKGGSLHALGQTFDAAARAHYLATGQYEIAAGIRKFATGGGFRVGGAGGVDSKLATMALSPGEYVNVSHGDAMGAMAKEVGQLRQDLRIIGATLAANTGQTAKLQKRWDGDGLPATRVI